MLKETMGALNWCKLTSHRQLTYNKSDALTTEPPLLILYYQYNKTNYPNTYV